ncbi:MAG: hypothetical protein ACFFCT_06760 [Candidatus Odinarchaeota archaeon]
MVTQSDSDDRVQDDKLMPDDDTLKLERKLSPSAQAILRFVRIFEEGGKIDVMTEDADFFRLQQIVTSYRGSLYVSLMKRLGQVLKLGAVEIITQRDVMSLITQLWEDNISMLSKTELAFLEAVVHNPGASLKDLSLKANQTYSQCRRAQKRLFDSGVLKIGGMINVHKLGLERVLIVLENPSFVLSGPYCQKSLFIDDNDGSPLVLTVATVPFSKRKEFLDVVRSLRNSSTNTKAYGLSAGHPNFNSIYSTQQQGWKALDLFHFRLMLRKGSDPITISGAPVSAASEILRIKKSDTLVMDALVESLDGTANDIVKTTNLSQSSAFRKRAGLLNDEIILPRARVNIPQLSDRIVVVCSPEVGGNINPGWHNLPLTYMSQISNLEDKSDRKMLFIAALPTGLGKSVLDVLDDETSKVDDYSAWIIDAAIGGTTKVSPMYDRRRNTWAWDVSQHFDVTTYSVMRREASPHNIPIDLA